MDRSALAENLEERRDQSLRLDLHSGKTTDLADQDREGHACEETDKDGAGEKTCQDAELQQLCSDAKETDPEGKGRGDGDPIDA